MNTGLTCSVCGSKMEVWLTDDKGRVSSYRCAGCGRIPAPYAHTSYTFAITANTTAGTDLA